MNKLSLEEEVPKKVLLRSSDGQVFEVEEAVIRESDLIKNMIESGLTDERIPLENVSGTILAKVVDYCKKHAGGQELKKWDAEYIEQVDMGTLYHLFVASKHLGVEGLMDLCAQRVADTIKGKQVDEIRKAFNIPNDFTPDEEEAIRNENPWAF